MKEYFSEKTVQLRSSSLKEEFRQRRVQSRKSSVKEECSEVAVSFFVAGAIFGVVALSLFVAAACRGNIW